MPNVLDYDTIDAVIGTEHLLIDETKNKVYSGWVDLGQMTDGDKVQIITYIKVLPTTPLGIYKNKTYYNAQADPETLLPYVPSDVEIKITLTQLEGTPKDFPWKVYAD
jgi:hypothetical protein